MILLWISHVAQRAFNLVTVWMTETAGDIPDGCLEHLDSWVFVKWDRINHQLHGFLEFRGISHYLLYKKKIYIKSNNCFRRRGKTREWQVNILDQQSYTLDPEYVLQPPGNRLSRKLTMPLTWKTAFKYKYITLKQGNPDIFLSFSQVYALSFTQRHHCGWSLSPWA